MDMVEARKKAKEMAQKQAEAASERGTPSRAQGLLPEEKKPEKKIEKKVGAGLKPAPTKPLHKKVKAKKTKFEKAPKSAPRPGVVEKKEPAKPLPDEEAFVDMSFGEDLPELKGKEKELILEEKKPVAPSLEREKVKEKPEDVGAGFKPALLEKEPEKDFYELVVEDLVQYGYGAVEAEKDLIELLGFRLGPEIYAIPLVKIQQIIKPRPITLVPGAPGYILGIISLRGMIIPIFDLRQRLGLEPSPPSRQTRIIIIKIRENVLAGLYVDQVLEVARISQSTIEAPHAIFSPAGTGMEGDFLEGIARHKNQMLIILNLDQVILARKEEGKAG